MVQYEIDFGGIMKGKYYYVVQLILSEGKKIDLEFNPGEELEFVELLKELSAVCKRDLSDDSKEAIEDTIYRLLESESAKLDWDKVFINLDIADIDINTLDIFEDMFTKVHYDTFKMKVNRSNNIVLVHYYYMEYAILNGLPMEEVMAAYDEYLDNYYQRINRSYNSIFDDIMDEIDNNVMSFMYNNICIDESATYVLKKLLDKIDVDNLDYDIIYKFCELDVNYCNQLIRKFLEVSKKVEYKYSIRGSRRERTDRVALNFYINNPKGVIESFNDENYLLYDKLQMSSLVYNTYYSNDDNTFKDNFNNCVDDFYMQHKNGTYGGFEHNLLESIIYSDKIKIVKYETLLKLKELLDKDVFNEYMLYIIDNDIKVYFGDQILYTTDYMMTKAPRKVSANLYEKNKEVQEFLYRDKYLGRSK